MGAGAGAANHAMHGGGFGWRHFATASGNFWCECQDSAVIGETESRRGPALDLPAFCQHLPESRVVEPDCWGSSPLPRTKLLQKLLVSNFQTPRQVTPLTPQS